MTLMPHIVFFVTRVRVGDLRACLSWIWQLCSDLLSRIEPLTGLMLCACRDMWQSKHPAGLLHATARVISGGPVYVSDRPGVHDFALLRRVVMPDGSVLRPLLPGRPTWVPVVVM